ncbi:outer membrane beta-barrel protein [Sphingomonas sp. MMS24-JH45]
MGRDGGAPAGAAPQGIRLPRTSESEIRLPVSAAAGDVDSGGLKASPAASTARGQTVANRRRPDFDPAGIRTRAFLVYPEASSTVGYDSNVYRQPSGSPDAYGRLRGALRVQSDLARHALLLTVSSTSASMRGSIATTR